MKRAGFQFRKESKARKNEKIISPNKSKERKWIMLVGLKVQRPEALTWPQWRLLKSTEMKEKSLHNWRRNISIWIWDIILNFFFNQLWFLMRTTKIKSSQVLLEKGKLENGAFWEQNSYFSSSLQSQRNQGIFCQQLMVSSTWEESVCVCRHSLMKRNQAIRAFQMAFAQHYAMLSRNLSWRFNRGPYSLKSIVL